MNLSEILIVYLAFGAPFAVHNYLASAVMQPARRLAGSVVTLFFWFPLAVRLVRRHLLHAYSGRDFVSEKILDAENTRLTVLSEAAVAELVNFNNDHSVHQIREVIARYVGLSLISRHSEAISRPEDSDLLRAAGREDPELGMICLLRKQQRHLERHLDQARRSWVSLYTSAAKAGRAHEAGIQLATELVDTIAVDQLLDLRQSIERTDAKPARVAELKGTAVPAVSFTVD
jgi:hypothetical protein